MRKPENIKDALAMCAAGDCSIYCPFDKERHCQDKVMLDALVYIDQLEETISLMKIQMHGDCGVCKHRTGFDVEGAIMSQKCFECLRKESRPNWEYEGLSEVEGKC